MKYNGKEIVVVCPSYKRYKVETLAYIPFCKVYVAPEEYESYIDYNPNAFNQSILLLNFKTI